MDAVGVSGVFSESEQRAIGVLEVVSAAAEFEVVRACFDQDLPVFVVASPDFLAGQAAQILVVHVFQPGLHVARLERDVTSQRCLGVRV
eukprot:CAMPEP_0116993074 /NCGR_PEP_ID=MMETSP0467-20121206/67227_1 /TAXON_ID=283647 /ORGANISM="Mesodinium pulex, Strain SPMC105" /LENGTH=88 /DNA_ID=CAMNT_0004690699 /DNA_START=890 /DNA_END=1156 /DNA_ORIENTATION=-